MRLIDAYALEEKVISIFCAEAIKNKDNPIAKTIVEDYRELFVALIREEDTACGNSKYCPKRYSGEYCCCDECPHSQSAYEDEGEE